MISSIKNHLVNRFFILDFLIICALTNTCSWDSKSSMEELMGNDDVYEIKGIETFYLKMHNRVVKTLIEVWYVLYLKEKSLFT